MAVENVTKKTSFTNLLCQLDFVILVKFATESAHNLVLKNENGTQRIGRNTDTRTARAGLLSSPLSKSSLFWDPTTVTRWPWWTSALSRFFAHMRRNCGQAIVWNTLKGLKPIVCTPTVTIAVPEAFRKTLGFCLTLSFYI